MAEKESGVLAISPMVDGESKTNPEMAMRDAVDSQRESDSDTTEEDKLGFDVSFTYPICHERPKELP